MSKDPFDNLLDVLRTKLLSADSEQQTQMLRQLLESTITHPKRGTPTAVTVAPAPSKPSDSGGPKNKKLMHQVRTALTEECMSIRDLAAKLGMPVNQLAAFFQKELCKFNLVAPVLGYGPVGDNLEFFPQTLWKHTVWCWCLEEIVSKDNLRAYIQKLMMQLPVGLAAIARAVKMEKKDVSPELTEIRRQRDDIWEFSGTQTHNNFLYIYPSKKPPQGTVWVGSLPLPRQGGRYAQMTSPQRAKSSKSTRPINPETLQLPKAMKRKLKKSREQKKKEKEEQEKADKAILPESPDE